MKKLLLIWIFSGSLDGFSQINPKIDTVFSVLLVTYGPSDNSRSVEGHCIRYHDFGGRCLDHLDAFKKPLQQLTYVWNCQKYINPILNCGDAQPYRFTITNVRPVKKKKKK